MDTFDDLTGKFLVSTPKMPDPRFAENVIFICSHDEMTGAMGVAVNRPYREISMSKILSDLDLPMPERELSDIYIGGPVEIEAGFILFDRKSYSGAGEMVVTENIALSRDKTVLEDIARGNGPDNYLFILGYAGWGVGQLEEELTRNGWLVLPASDEIIFHVPAEKRWRAAAEQYGIDISLFDDETGSA